VHVGVVRFAVPIGLVVGLLSTAAVQGLGGFRRRRVPVA
jgi:hypothetical protein